MNKSRIIRPISGDLATSRATELNIDDVRALSRQMVQEARERVRDMEAKREAIEAESRAHRERDKADAEKRQADLEQELAALREQRLESFETERKEALEAARNEGFEDGRRGGFEEGYADGRQAGYSEGRETELDRIREETERVLPTVRSLLAEITSRKSQLAEAARTELLQLAVEIAKRVIKREVRDFHSEVVLENLREAIDLIFLRNKVTVQLHHDDLPVVEKYAPEMLESFGGVESFEIRPVADVARGGCRIVSGSGAVDLSLDVQLQVIEDALLDGAAEFTGADSVPLAAVPRAAEPPEASASAEDCTSDEVDVDDDATAAEETTVEEVVS